MENKLKSFINLLQGEFDNKEQFDEMKSKGNKDFPFARHINNICNSKISNLPKDYEGIFMLEESYYKVNEKVNPQPHLFCFFQENENIKLVSYEMPKGYTKEDFVYSNIENIDFLNLKVSEKFTPAIYEYKNNSWEGGSVSHFSQVLKFTLFEKFSEEKLEVTETMEVNGKKTFGFDEPIIYKRIKQEIM